MSHDRGCFKCFAEKPWKTCAVPNCPKQEKHRPEDVVITGSKGERIVLRPGDTCTIVNTARRDV